jgi:hypothetical protein
LYEEGKVIDFFGEDLDDELLERVPAEYFTKPPVLGRLDALAGAEVLVPTTIYEIAGDDTSGVAGILLPTQEFIEAAQPKPTARYFDYDETREYEKFLDHNGVERVRGNSWFRAPVLWNGTVVGSINQAGLDGDEGDEVRNTVKRRWRDDSLLGDWPSKESENLRRAPRRGTVVPLEKAA